MIFSGLSYTPLRVTSTPGFQSWRSLTFDLIASGSQARACSPLRHGAPSPSPGLPASASADSARCRGSRALGDGAGGSSAERWASPGARGSERVVTLCYADD